MRVSEAFERYRKDVIVFTNQSPKTEESLRSCLSRLLTYAGDIEIEQLTFETVRDWKTNMTKTCSINTVRGYIIKLRVVLAYLKKIGIDTLDPELVPVPKRQQTAPKFITPEEVTNLINAAFRVRSKAIISLLYASGIRISELCQLDRGMIHNRSFTVIGKGGKPRLCFIDERTETLINAYLETRHDHHPALFLSSQKECRMTSTNIQFIMKAACKKAGINKNVTPHVLRHSFATNMLGNNANMRHIQVMLGHESLQTTQMYAHVVDVELQQIYNSKHTT